MPISYSFDTRIVVVRMEGKYSTGELKDAILAAVADPACPADPVMMFDLRDSQSLEDRSADEVRDMARFLASHGARFGNRLGMVAPTDLSYGLMRIGAVTAEMKGLSAEVFRTFEEARDWLLAGANAGLAGEAQT